MSSNSGFGQPIVGGKLVFPASQQPHPPLFFGGSSPASHAYAAKHVDLYLTWGEPPVGVAEKIADIRTRAARHGRTLRFGVRLHIIVRETTKEAWAGAADLISRLDEATIARAQAAQVRMDSVGQSARDPFAASRYVRFH